MTNYKEDLHIHSIYSDGSKTPKEILKMAREKKVKVLAITDHDNIEGSKELIKIANKDVTVYSGVELTIKVPQGRCHLLGYNIDLNNEELNTFLKEIKENSIYNVLLYIQLLKREFGIIIPDDEINKLVKSVGNIGRPQLALILIKLGFCQTVDEAFIKYLRTVYEKGRGLKKGLTIEQGINLILAADGIPVIAHPNSLMLSKQELFEKIDYMKKVGLKGIETTHINESAEERKYFHELAEYFKLLESGGTDFHGKDVKPDVELATGRSNNVNIEYGSLSLTKKIKSRYI